MLGFAGTIEYTGSSIKEGKDDLMTGKRTERSMLLEYIFFVKNEVSMKKTEKNVPIISEGRRRMAVSDKRICDGYLNLRR